jgi:hypothetical protein
MFHFAAVPVNAVFLEFYAGKCGKNRRILRLAQWPVWTSTCLSREWNIDAKFL